MANNNHGDNKRAELKNDKTCINRINNSRSKDEAFYDNQTDFSCDHLMM